MKKAEGCSEPFSNRPFCNHCCVAASSHSFVCLGVETGGLRFHGRETEIQKTKVLQLGFLLKFLGHPVAWHQFFNDDKIFDLLSNLGTEVISGFSSGSALVIMQLGLFWWTTPMDTRRSHGPPMLTWCGSDVGRDGLPFLSC